MSAYVLFFCIYIFYIIIVRCLTFFPDYNNSLFPLFLDIQTILIFIPSYSILFYGVFLHLIKNKLKKNTFFRNSQVNKFIVYLYIFIMSIILLHVQDFYSLKARILLVILSIILGFLISTVLDILFDKNN